jgi:pilus assembly protein CpaF
MFRDFKSKSASEGSKVIRLEHPVNNPSPKSAPRPEPETLRQRAYLELKSRMHEALLDRLNLAIIDKVERTELKRQIAHLVGQLLESDGTPMNADMFNTLVEELIFEVLGLGPLEPLLADPSVDDILVNAHDNIYVERFGLLERTSVRFLDERHLLRIIDKIVSRVGRRIDESQPWVDARLEDGSRVNAIIRPCSVDGPALSIRKFSAKRLTLDLLVQAGSLTPKAAEMLQAMVEARLNVLISGGTGSGKTTMLNAMSCFIDKRQRIVTIEDAAELQLQQDHVVRLETRPANTEGQGAVNQRDLVRNALRMRPDRIIVGEVRGVECFDMLQAMNTGHDGSMTTVHANTARDALSRIEQMVTMLGADIPIQTIRNQVAAGIHVVVQLNRMADGKRRVTSISELTGMEGDVITMQDIFVFKRQGKSATGEILGDMVMTGIRPKCADLLAQAGLELPLHFFSRDGVPA